VPSALSKSLDEAFALWKQLLASPGVPAVRSPEQTVASLHLLAALYKLMAKVTLPGRWLAGRQSPSAVVSECNRGGLPALSPCKPWRATSWSEACAVRSGTAWARPVPCARSPSCSSSWSAPATPRQVWQGGKGPWGELSRSPGRSPHAGVLVSSFSCRRWSPACRKPTAARIPTCCCSKPASCSAASCAASAAR